MIERLKNIEGNKVAHLVHEMNEIQKDIDRVDYIAATTGEQLANNKVIEFLGNFKDMQQSIE
jgi:heme oxygenase